MYWLVALMTIGLMGIILMGIYYEFYPLPKTASTKRRLTTTLALNVLVFLGAQLALLFLGIQEVVAVEASTGATREISVGVGLAMIGVGIPTAVGTIGAGIAVGPIGAASLAVIAEKPEVFGRTLVYLGLAEGIAIYGLVITIIMLRWLG